MRKTRVNTLISTKEYIENEILTRIRNCVYDENTIISESKICEELNVSRTPVREALIHLSASHLDNLKEEDYLLMNEYIDLMDIDIKYRKFESYNSHQEAFHNVYVNKCDNYALIKILEYVKSSIPTYLYHSTEGDKLFSVLRELNAQHREILSLIKQKKTKELRNFQVKNHCYAAHTDMN